jgi:gamma-glutamyltranspeptidase/glutathione hydrolase
MHSALGALAALVLAGNATSSHGAIATAHLSASQAGAEAMRRGGNAVDAAVAAAFTLSVVEQYSSGIGGGGFALVYVAKEKKVHVLDFREIAPKAATAGMYVKDGKPRQDLSRDGPLAIAVPGAVKGYAELVRRFGKRPLAEATAAGEKIAAEGYWVTRSFHHAAKERLAELRADPEAAKLFLVAGDNGEKAAPEPGHKLVQKDLAATLHAIGKDGADAFYKGPIAERMVKGVRSRGGILTLEDLAGYQVRDREPIAGQYRGWKIVTMPPPSSGGVTLLALLNVLELEDAKAGGYHPEKFLHVMIEAEKRIFAKRETLFGDPLFAPEVKQATLEMISPAFAKALRGQIGEKATPATEIESPAESPDTTHISVVDGEGNAVALTTTVNYPFGACVVAPGTGVVLNDEMDDFAIAPGVPNAYGLRGGKANAPAPGKTPLSSMTPTFLFDKEGRVRLAIGAPGGSTIPTTVAQAIVNIVDYDMRIDRAIAAPRIHHQLHPDHVRVEPAGLEAATVKALEARGHVIHYSDKTWGNAQAVFVEKNGYREAASDPRGEGQGATP